MGCLMSHRGLDMTGDNYDFPPNRPDHAVKPGNERASIMCLQEPQDEGDGT
jgi:hypothetical protein